MTGAHSDPAAWVVRMHTAGGDVVDAGIASGAILLGWSDARGLIDCDDYWEFREIVHGVYHAEDSDYRRSGQAASQLWSFIHEMKEGDLVVVPHGPAFYVGEVSGPAAHVDVADPPDTSHRRPVRWLNNAEPLPRQYARSALISRMRSQKTVTKAADLVDEIREALGTATADEPPTLSTSLRQALIDVTKRELLEGHMDERRFEELVRDLMLALGALDARVVGRRVDIGADIEAEFSVGRLVNVPVRVQVKYWRGEAGVAPIDQLLNAMADVDIGAVVTTASFSDEARQHARVRAEDTGKQIVLVDGDELCRLIVEHGLSEVLTPGDRPADH